MDRIHIAGLTDKENEVARYVQQGFNNVEIAAYLGKSMRMVTYHIKNIFRKLKLKNRIEIAIMITVIDKFIGMKNV